MGDIRLLSLEGSAGDIGRSHGTAYRDDIRRYAEERIALVTSGLWSGGPLSRADVLDIAESCVPFHHEFSSELATEMEAIGEAAGLSPAEMVVVGGFTDFVDTVRAAVGGPLPIGVFEDDCTAFIVPDNRGVDGRGYYGQTWDMHDTATQFVILTDVEPDDRPRSLVFTTTGCVGQIGMNEAGVAVGINNLTGSDGRPGVTWPLVVRHALEQETADRAIDVIVNAPVAGAHSYLIFDSAGSGAMIEKTPSRTALTALADEPLIHTNHMLDGATREVEVERPTELQRSSLARLERAAEMLAQTALDETDLMAVTRDEQAVCQVATDPFHVESCGAAIMQPATLDFWAVWGLPKDNDYQRFSLEPTRA